jgi:hypothetical protein
MTSRMPGIYFHLVTKSVHMRTVLGLGPLAFGHIDVLWFDLVKRTR